MALAESTSRAARRLLSVAVPPRGRVPASRHTGKVKAKAVAAAARLRSASTAKAAANPPLSGAPVSEAASETVRQVIDRAPIVPPAPELLEPDQPEPVRLRGLPIALLGIGQATAGDGVERYGIGDPVFLYLDTFGRRRILRPEQHNRIVIRSLFILYEPMLSRLWPKQTPRAGFDDHRAAEELIADQGRVGIYRAERPAMRQLVDRALIAAADAAGAGPQSWPSQEACFAAWLSRVRNREQLAAEADNRGYILIQATRFAWQTLQKLGDPYLTLARLRAWNPREDGLAAAEFPIIVDRLCRRLLRQRGNSRG
jgi:hypothetical protein